MTIATDAENHLAYLMKKIGNDDNNPYKDLGEHFKDSIKDQRKMTNDWGKTAYMEFKDGSVIFMNPRSSISLSKEEIHNLGFIFASELLSKLSKK